MGCDVVLVDDSTTAPVLQTVEETVTLVVDDAGHVVEAVEQPITITVQEQPVVLVAAEGGAQGPPGPGFGATITVTAADSPFLLPLESVLVLVDTSDGDVELQLPDVTNHLLSYDVKKLVDPGTITVTSPSGDTIEDAASATIEFMHTSIRFRFDQATGWWAT